MAFIDDPEATNQILGSDIMFTDDFQVSPSGDYLEVVDAEAVRQSLYHRLVTRPGEYKLRPEYGVGVGDYLKKAMTKSNLDELHQRIIDNLSQEARISKVNQVSVDKTSYGGRPGLLISISVEILGRVQSFRPFLFVDSV